MPQVRRLCASGQILRLQKANLPDHTGPFPNQLVDNIRRRWFNRLDPRGTTDLSRVEPGQPFLLELEAALLAAANDPDAEYPHTLAACCPLGVEEEIPFRRDVWPRARDHTGEPPLQAPQPCQSNHASCREHETQLRESLKEDVQDGFAKGPFTQADAKRVCQSNTLVHGALGAKPEMKIMKDVSRRLTHQVAPRRRGQAPAHHPQA